MKLSEAIREGAKQYPKVTGALMDRDAYDRPRVCALGAAYVGVFGRLPKHDDYDGFNTSYQQLRERFPELTTRVEIEQGCDPVEMLDAIWMKNDTGNNTREQIADWVESLGY